jgi:hypothetical protein
MNTAEIKNAFGFETTAKNGGQVKHVLINVKEKGIHRTFDSTIYSRPYIKRVFYHTNVIKFVRENTATRLVIDYTEIGPRIMIELEKARAECINKFGKYLVVSELKYFETVGHPSPYGNMPNGDEVSNEHMLPFRYETDEE